MKKKAPKQLDKKDRQAVVLKVIMLVLFVSGLATFGYPLISSTINNFHDQIVIENYTKEFALLSKKEQANRLSQMKKANANLLKDNKLTNVPGMGLIKDPFTTSVAPGQSSDQAYLKKHLVGAIYIPAITVSLPLFDETNDVLLDEGATILQGTSFPIGGIGTHSVITGHSGVPEKKLFTDLDQLKKGDLFYIEIDGKKLAYQVETFQTVLPDQLDSLKIVDGLDQVTLVTCTPYMINTYRLLVTGYRVPYVEKKSDKQIKTTQNSHRFQYFSLIGLIMFSIIVFIYLVWRIIFKKPKTKAE